MVARPSAPDFARIDYWERVLLVGESATLKPVTTTAVFVFNHKIFLNNILIHCV